MKQYSVLIVIVVVVVAIGATVRFLPPRTIVVEKDAAVTIYDTVRIIETADKRHFRARKVELNRADSAALVSVYRVGAVFQQRIIDYRTRLGGFYAKEQLKEIKGITEEVYEKIHVNFWVDTLAIQKININFATQKQLEGHPYFTPSMRRRLTQVAQMKGGYQTLGQLLNDNILLPKEAQKIAPYVSFGSPAKGSD